MPKVKRGDKKPVSKFQFVMMLIGGALLFGLIVYAANGGFLNSEKSDAAYTVSVAKGKYKSVYVRNGLTYQSTITIKFEAQGNKVPKVTSTNGNTQCYVDSRAAYRSVKCYFKNTKQPFLTGTYQVYNSIYNYQGIRFFLNY